MTDIAAGASIDLAHELRTPLHAIIAAAELVLSGDAGPISGQAAGLVAEIASAARRLEVVAEMLVAGLLTTPFIGLGGDAV